MSWKTVFLVTFNLTHFAFADQIKFDVNILFRYPKRTTNRIQTYSVKDEFKYSIARTGTAANLDKTPAKAKIDSHFTFTKDAHETSFVLIVENKTKNTTYFFAAPHTYKPEGASISAVFECLCNHHVYVIPPKSVWYRIVRVDVDFDTLPKGVKQAELIHDFIEVSESDAKSKYRKLMYEQL